MNNTAKTVHVFHSNATSISTGNDYSISNSADICKLDFIIEDGTTFTTEISVKVTDDSEWKLIPIVKDSTCTIITNGTINDASSNYTIDLRGIAYLRVDLTDISGTLDVLGRMVG